MPAFPDVDMELTAQIALGADLTAAPSTWVWTDLTCSHPSIPAATISRLTNSPITIKRGVVVGAGSPATTTATLSMFNHDGALTPFLMSSPYAPYVDSGTPIRLARRTQTAVVDTFTRAPETNGWGTTTTGEAWLAQGTVSAFTTTGTQAQVTHTAINTSRGLVMNRRIRNVDVVFDAAINAVQTAVGSLIGPQLRRNTGGTTMYWPHLVFNTSGNIAVRSYRYLNGGVTSSATTTVPGLTYTAGALIRCRIQVEDTTIRVRAWLVGNSEPSVWHLTITDTAIPAAGDNLAFGTFVSTGNTNTMPTVFTVDNVTITELPTYPLEGFITDVRPSFLPQPGGGTWSTALVDVGGVGSRLEKQQAPAYSPLRRSIQQAALTPVAYWPLEDDEGSVTAASAFPGGPTMAVVGPAVFSFGTGVPDDVYQSRFGTKPLVSVAAGARLTGAVPAPSVTNQWAVSMIAQFFAPDVPGVTEMRVLAWDTPGGTYNRWALVATTSGSYQVRAYNDTLGTVTTAFTDSFGSYSTQLSYSVEAQQVGGNITVQIFYNDVQFQAPTSIPGTIAPITRMIVNPDRVNTTASLTTKGLRFIVGHVRVVDNITVSDMPFYTDPTTGQFLTATKAWYLETAHSRISRLCTEERIPCAILGSPATTGYTQLNAQRDGSFTTLVQQAAESESGMIVSEAGFGYRVLPRTTRYNQNPALVIDLATYGRSADTDQGDVLVPQLESRATNYWTVTRAGGSSATFAADLAYRKRRGTIAEEVTIDALTDDVLPDHAAWRTHLNVDTTGAYYPSAPLDLSANPGLVADWLGCDIGSRTQRLNQPSLAGVGVIDQVIVGYTETLSPRSWLVDLSVTPAEVWDVGVYDTDPYDAATTTVGGSGLTTTATSVTFSSTDKGDTWSTTPGYKVIVNGERMVVTAMGAQTGTGPYLQAATVTRSDNGVVRAHPAGTPIHVDNPLRWGL